MGVLRPLVKTAQAVNPETDIAPSDKLATPATALTAVRPIIGGAVAYMLLKGKKPATAVAFVAGITDMEGWVARKISTKQPDSKLGISNKGKLLDPIADTIMLGEITAGILFAPRVSRLGKVAVTIVAIQEAVKAHDVVKANNEYRALTGMTLEIPVSDQGKEAMAEKMLAGGLATTTNDIEGVVSRTAVGLAALGFGIAGALRGRSAHKKNMQVAQEIAHEAYVRQIIMDDNTANV